MWFSWMRISAPQNIIFYTVFHHSEDSMQKSSFLVISGFLWHCFFGDRKTKHSPRVPESNYLIYLSNRKINPSGHNQTVKCLQVTMNLLFKTKLEVNKGFYRSSGFSRAILELIVFKNCLTLSLIAVFYFNFFFNIFISSLLWACELFWKMCEKPHCLS